MSCGAMGELVRGTGVKAVLALLAAMFGEIFGLPTWLLDALPLYAVPTYRSNRCHGLRWLS